MKSSSKSASPQFDAQVANKVVDHIKEIVGVCQTKAEISESLRQMTYQAAYGAALAEIRYERSGKGLEVSGVDRMKAEEEAQKRLRRAPGEKDIVGECKQEAKEGMDQEVKALISQFSSVGLANEAKGFVASWYAALQSVGTDRFKEHQIRMESLSEMLKLEATMRDGK